MDQVKNIAPVTMATLQCCNINYWLSECVFLLLIVSLLLIVRFERIRLFDIRRRVGLVYKLSS